MANGQQAPPWRTFRPTAGVTPQEAPSPSIWDRAKQVWQAGDDVGEWLSEQAGKQILSKTNPMLYRHYERQMQAGIPVASQDIYRSIRRGINPEWEGPNELDRAGGFLAQAAQYPAMMAGAGLGGRLTGGIPIPGVGMAGALTGGGAGWYGARTLAELANPDLAGHNVLWDVATLGGGKLVGSAAKRVAGSPAGQRLLYKAKKLLPKGKQRIPGEGAVAGEQLPLGVPGVPRQQQIPGLQPPGRPTSTYPGEVPFPSGAEQRGLPFPRELIQEGIPGTHTRVRVPRSVVNNLPPPRESLPTLRQWNYPAASKREQAGFEASKPFRPEGLEPSPRLGPDVVTMPGTQEPLPIPRPGARTMPRRTFDSPAPQPARPYPGQFAQGQQSMPPRRSPGSPSSWKVSPVEGYESTQLAKRLPPVLQKMTPPAQATAMKEAEELYKYVAKAGENLTYKQFATGMIKHTGMNRRDSAAVLRVTKMMARAYDETDDQFIGRQFRGIMGQKQWSDTMEKWRGQAGIAGFMHDGKAMLGFAEKIRKGTYQDITQLEAGMHEPMHVFLNNLPTEAKGILTNALRGSQRMSGTRNISMTWTMEEDEKLVRWGLEYLKSGKLPQGVQHKGLQQAFDRFRTFLKDLIRRAGAGKGKAPKEVNALLDKMLTPGAMKEFGKPAALKATPRTLATGSTQSESVVRRALKTGRKKRAA